MGRSRRMPPLDRNDGCEIVLRPMAETDLDWVVAQEGRPEFDGLVLRWPRERHAASLSDPDKRCFVIGAAADPDRDQPAQDRLGYVIMAGAQNESDSVELIRIAVIEPGRGIGALAIEAVKAFAFRDLQANRLWLDVFDDNDRARRAYMRAGFSEEGVLREAIRRPDGTYVSLVVMSILKREWSASRASI